MTSSIYPQPVSINFVGSVVTLTIVDGGSGYTVPVITIDPPSGTTAIGTASVNSGGGISSITITNQGAGYTAAPVVTIAAPVSGTQATGTANLSNGQVISITITNAGSGYTSTPTVTIADPSGVTATATPTTSDGVIATISALGGTLSGYQDGESITLSSDMSGTGATATADISGGVIQSITITDGGSGFVGGDAETVTIAGVTSLTATATFTVTTISDDVITSVSLDVAGSGYTSVPNVIASGGGTGAMITATISSVLSGDILSNDIAITDELVSPGGGGILRLYFAFIFDTTPGDITVTNNGVDKGALNADNDTQIISNAYYRFDIDVESGDNINLELKGTASAMNIASINFIRAHLVQFGA